MGVIKLAGDPNSEDIHEPIDRRGRPRPAEHNRMVFIRRNTLTNDRSGLLTKTARLQPRARRFGVGIRIEREDRVADRPDAV